MLNNLVDLVEKIKNNELKASEVVERGLERIEERDPEINAFVSINENAVEESKEKEDKPLAGIPIAVKDNVATKNLKTTYGSKLYEDNIPDQDAVIVERLKEAGAVIIGKTNLPEFALIAYTDNPKYGPTKNPWDLERTVGGSSGGSAAAVLSDMVPAATGNDGGGSIRIPSAFCGLYGLKPSYGRVPSYPGLPLFIGLHSEGFLTKRVEDTAFLLDIVKDRDPRDMDSVPEDESYQKGIETGAEDVKIAYSPDLSYATVDSEVSEIVKEAAFSLEEFGSVEEVDLDVPNLEMDLINKVVSEVLTFLGDRLEEWKEVGYEAYLPFLAIGEELSYKEYVKIEQRKEELWKKLRPIFEDYDFLITPTTAVPPFELGDIGVNEINGENVSALGWMAFTYHFNFTGQPAASIPAGFTSDDLPVGMQIVGNHYSDLDVLRISKSYQDIVPWQEDYENLEL